MIASVLIYIFDPLTLKYDNFSAFDQDNFNS